MKGLLYSAPSWIARRVFPRVLWRVETRNEPILYLTFDDGPTADGTAPLLELLDRYDARATFFLLGSNAEKHGDLVGRIVSSGHAVGNHSHTHADPWFVSGAALQAEMDSADRVLRTVVGKQIHLARPPFGRLRPAFVSWCARNAYRVVMWDVVTGDFDRGVTASAAAGTVRTYARPGSVVVLHDNAASRATMMGAVEEILARFSENGWRFDALPEDG